MIDVHRDEAGHLPGTKHLQHLARIARKDRDALLGTNAAREQRVCNAIHPARERAMGIASSFENQTFNITKERGVAPDDVADNHEPYAPAAATRCTRRSGSPPIPGSAGFG